jgi:hypothetical protein
MLMIHCAWTIAAGNQYEFAELSEFLAKIDNEVIMGAYQNKTKKSKKEICSMMKDTTYMTAKEAKEHGFVDEIVTGKSVKAEYDLSIFNALTDEFHADGEPEHNKRMIEKALRDVGFSQNSAKAFIARGLKAESLVPDPPPVPPVIVPPQDDSNIIARLKSNINLLGGN